MKNPVVRGADILLPAAHISLEKWSVVAVDQYTSQLDYWQQVEAIVGDAPSALKLTLPEVYLAESESRTAAMQEEMKEYLADGTVEKRVENGMILVERSTETGVRLGLMACLDLEQYDYTAGSQSMIRATEGTVIERVPPRVKIRRGAALELPHVLMLLDDPACTVIEPIYARREGLECLYDFELMQGGGHLRGWKIDPEMVAPAMDALYGECGGLFLAVGDGNHSLAAARAYWLELKQNLPESEWAGHPARYALAEIENLHSPAIQFEPIHRVVTGVNPAVLISDFEETLGKPEGDNVLKVVTQQGQFSYRFADHPLKDLQNFLDAWLMDHPGAEIDYIHGDDTLRSLADRPDAVGFMPCGFAKSELFPFIRKYGVLPRKTFSMGHAHEKRFYLEARKIEG